MQIAGAGKLQLENMINIKPHSHFKMVFSVLFARVL